MSVILLIIAGRGWQPREILLYPIHAITPKAGLQSARTINRKFHQPGTHSPYVMSWLPLSKEQHEIIIATKKMSDGIGTRAGCKLKPYTSHLRARKTMTTTTTRPSATFDRKYLSLAYPCQRTGKKRLVGNTVRSPGGLHSRVKGDTNNNHLQRAAAHRI
ncbi:hypothetical protein CPC08DRAFT_751716 [Agrocybe pediades]|nr:hypothetical protein CPC08DRAFT_751716 [Agrocybe pediades]